MVNLKIESIKYKWEKRKWPVRVECLQLVRKNLGSSARARAVRGGWQRTEGGNFVHMFFSVY